MNRNQILATGRTAGTALLLALLPVTSPLACGYEDPNSLALRRGALNLAFPNALYVQGALTQAHLSGTIVVEPRRPVASDPFGGGFRKAARMLRRFGEELPDVSYDADGFAFSLVLMEPMLWTRFRFDDGQVRTEVHVDGSQPGDLVVVSAEAALREVVAGRLTMSAVEAAGLIRFYGDPADVAQFRKLFGAPDGMSRPRPAKDAMAFSEESAKVDPGAGSYHEKAAR
jgi:hypothetical protein